MKFTHNHTPGPWCFDGNDIHDIRVRCMGKLTIDLCPTALKPDIALIEQAPAMRDKLIEIAESMGGQIICLEMAKEIEVAGKLKQELALILEILILAGVEVEI